MAADPTAPSPRRFARRPPRVPRNLASAEPRRVELLRNQMNALREMFQAWKVEGGVLELDPETIKTLRSLGYMN